MKLPMLETKTRSSFVNKSKNLELFISLVTPLLTFKDGRYIMYKLKGPIPF